MDEVLQPGLPIFALDTPLHTCEWLVSVAAHEHTYWPRRNVWTTPVIYPNIPCPGACGGVYVALLCLN